MTSRREIWHPDSSEIVALIGGEGDERDDRREIVDELWWHNPSGQLGEPPGTVQRHIVAPAGSGNPSLQAVTPVASASNNTES